MIELTVADLAQAKDLELGASPWFEVTQPRVQTFADATGDHQWIHVDVERAAAGPFGQTVAHGYLTLSLVPYLFTQMVTVVDQVQGLNYGLDKVRFTSVVPVGSRIRLRASVVSGDIRPDGGLLYRVALRIEIEGQERPAMVGESLFLSYAATPLTDAGVEPAAMPAD